MSLAEVEAAELRVEGEEIVGRWRDVRDRLLHNPSAVIGMVLIALFVLTALLAPVLAPYDPRAVDLTDIRPGYAPGPSAEHWLGVDLLGRDQLSRILYGARYSLLVAVVSLLFGAAVGMLLGGLAGAIGGWVDNVIMRLMDVALAIPGLLLAIGLAVLLGRSLTSLMVAIGATNVPVFARLLRASMLSQRESDYVLAARAVGVRPLAITMSHVLPNSIAPVIVQGTLAMATAIVDAAGLAFLGLGSADPGIPEWGRMLTEAQRYVQQAPHLVIAPGLAIVLSVLGFNLLGDGLREALDPKLRR